MRLPMSERFPVRLPALPGAACRGRDPRLWDDRLDGEIEDPTARRRRHVVARAVCVDCPVRYECRDARGDATGVWAGELWTEHGRAEWERLVAAGVNCETAAVLAAQHRKAG